MVSDQEGDAESHSMETGTVSVREHELRANLEIPEESREEMEMEVNNAENHVRNDVMTRACHVCGKMFGSGKALGGHMRIHKQDPLLKKQLNPQQSIKFKKQAGKPAELENKTMTIAPSGCDNGSYDKTADKPTCPVCWKKFKSPKSLFGHMRCHPDRDWRGITPPAALMGVSSISSSSYSSSLLDADPPEVVDPFQPSTSAEKVDMFATFNGWTVRAKRGRKALMLDLQDILADGEVMSAAHELMMLSRSKVSVDNREKFDDSEAAFSHPLKDEFFRVNEVPESKKQMIDQFPVGIAREPYPYGIEKPGVIARRFFRGEPSGSKVDQQWSGEQHSEHKKLCLGKLDIDSNSKNVGQQKKGKIFESNNGFKVKDMKNKKKKEEKLGAAASVDHKVREMTVPHDNKYQCNNSRDDRFFPTHKPAAAATAAGLGVHSSILNSMDDNGSASNPTAATQVKDTKQCNRRSGMVDSGQSLQRRMLEIDLNEMPLSTDDETATP